MKITKLDSSLFDLAAVAIIVTSAVMLFMLALERFDALVAVMAAGALVCLFCLACVRSIRLPRRAVLGAIILLGLAALLPRLHPGLYVWGGQDQGVYVQMSSYVERVGSLRGQDDLRRALPAADKTYYDAHNLWSDKNVKQGKFEGAYDPGVYVTNLQNSEYVFQFYPLHPMWMALWSTFGESGNRVYSVVLFSLLNILVLSLIAFELSGRRQWAGYITAALLASNTMHVFLAGFPLSESLVTFFSATMFYYLLLYWKRQAEEGGSNYYLVLSLGSWSCLVFAHISAFLFLPVMGLMVLSAVVFSSSEKAARSVGLYFILAIGVYCLSIQYGLHRSYPYTYATFADLLGVRLGEGFLDHFVALLASVAAVCVLVFAGAWRCRIVISTWIDKHGARCALYLSLGVLVFAAVYCSIVGYRLAFTDWYAHDSLIELYQLSGRGWNSLLHVTMFTLLVYASPFVFACAVFYVTRGFREAGGCGALFIITLAWLVLLKTAVDPRVYYYYYGRYLSADALPAMIVAAAIVLSKYFHAKSKHVRAGAIALLVLCLIWNGALLLRQGNRHEMQVLDASLRPLVSRITSDDLVLLDMDQRKYTSLRTALKFYYGKQAVFVGGSDEQLLDFIRAIPKTFLKGNIYILTPGSARFGVQDVDRFQLKTSQYARGKGDIVPMKGSDTEWPIGLYKVGVKEGLATLHAGSRIFFGNEGKSDWYVAQGWGEEEGDARWTEGVAATLRLPLAPGRHTCRFMLVGLTSRDVTVSVNGVPRKTWSVAGGGEYKAYELDIAESDTKQGSVLIGFDLHGAVSPAEIDPRSSDTRKLGIRVHTLEID